MAITLVTGAIGTGKTTWVVDQLMQEVEKNKKLIEKGLHDQVRKIYTNIAGLKIDHEPLPEKWEDTPKNSIIVYDEAHKIDIFQPSRKALHDDKSIQQMNESRHTGHDLYFITQASKFIHQHIRGLVNRHYHFHNPMGLKASTVFMWRHGNTTSPDSEGAKNKAESSFVYTFKKNVQENFSSVEDDAIHTQKRNIPKKIIFVIAAFLGLVSFLIYMIQRPETSGVITGDMYKQSGLVNKESSKPSNLSVGSIPQNQIVDQCRKAVNVDKPECVKWFNDLSQNKQSVQSPEEQTVSYNIDKPFSSADEIQKQISYQVSAKPVFSGCMYSNGSYTAYTQQGTKLHNISDADCKRLIKDSDRPFNYFAQDKQQQQQQQQPFEQSKPVQLSSEDIAKYQEAKRQGLI